MASQGTGPDAAETALAAARLGRELSSEQARLLSRYLSLLVKWNRKMNLTGPGDWRDILETRAADSWVLADFLSAPPASALFPEDDARLNILDFGAGAGLPGLPLRMFWARGTYHFIEARAKRAIFLRQALAELKLANARVFEGRAETFPVADCARAGFTLLLSRAFMPWPDFLAFSGSLFAEDYAVLLMTSEPPGEAAAPGGFSRLAMTAYQAAGKARYASVFIPVSVSR